MPTPSTSPTAPVVCALGLRVEDAAATLGRAERLLDKPFRQAVGPGELEIPAVRGLGGSLVYFIDEKSELGRVWEIEFVPTSEAETAGAASPTSTISPSPCTTKRCSPGCCSTRRYSICEDPGAGRARSRRLGEEPSGAVAGRRLADRA